jgi:hypothetical protein
MTDEQQCELFRSLGTIEANVKTLVEGQAKLAPLVEKHERVYQIGKYVVPPTLVSLHLALKHLFVRI